MKQKIIALVLFVLAFTACKENSQKEKVFKGYVIWEKDYTTFTNCETRKTYWLDDKTGEIENKYKSLAKEPYQEVYFEFKADLLPPSTKGVSSSFDNIMQVKTVVNAQAQPPENSCVSKDEKLVFSCFGENPNWTLGFGKDTKFTANYPNDTLVFFPLRDYEIRDSAGVGRIFYYTIGNENYQTIEVIISEQTCKVRKKLHRFTSKVLFGGIEYKGCASIKIINDEEYSNN